LALDEPLGSGIGTTPALALRQRAGSGRLGSGERKQTSGAGEGEALMSASRRPRPFGAVLGAIVPVLCGLLLMGIPVTVTTAQEATPAATPLPTGGVPCTFLFGIQDPEAACVLAIHAVPDAGVVDLYIDGALALPGLEFGILGDFVPVPSGEHQIQITAAGGDLAAALIDETVEFAAGVPYEVAAIGLAEDPQLLTRAVNTDPFPADSARLQVVHAAPDAPAIDFAVSGGDVLVANLEYLGLSEVVIVPAGAYVLDVRPAGEEAVVVSLGEAVLEANVNYTYYVIGLVADNTIGGFVVPVAVPAEAVEAVATPAP
jgi:hypothetical protein